MNGLPSRAAPARRTTTIVNAIRKYPTAGSSTPGSASIVARPPTNHDPAKSPSVAAATVSRARNAKIVATSSSGATKPASSSPIECDSVAATQGASSAAYRNMPIPNAKNPSGIEDP
jgi:hypothetical protein